MPRLEPTAWLLGTLLPMACANPCDDDGLLQQTCSLPAASDATPTEGAEATGTDASATEATEGSEQVDADGSGEDDHGASTSSVDGSSDGSLDGGGLTADSSGGGEGDPGGPWCLDADGDGFGDPTQCSDRPGPGTVPDDGDCNDDDPSTFPGAAEHEPDPQACTTDADDDGWGDATPADGAVAGADCWDHQPDLNPSVLHVGSVDNGPLDDVAATVDGATATLAVIAPIDTPLSGWNVTAAALREDGQLVVMEGISGRLQRIDYQAVCEGTSAAGESTAFGPNLGNLSVCGLSFDASDRLWAIDAYADMVLEIDPESGGPLSAIPLTMGGTPLQLGDCGLTWDCHEQRLLVAHATAGQVLALDPLTGQAELVAEYDPDLGSAALAYEPITRQAWVSSGFQLNHVPLDGSPAVEVGTFHYEGAMVADVANLAPLRICE